MESRQAIAAPRVRPFGRICLLLPETTLHYSAALMISSATSFGNDNIAT
jgi:hypothetical protein